MNIDRAKLRVAVLAGFTHREAAFADIQAAVLRRMEWKGTDANLAIHSELGRLERERLLIRLTPARLEDGPHYRLALEARELRVAGARYVLIGSPTGSHTFMIRDEGPAGEALRERASELREQAGRLSPRGPRCWTRPPGCSRCDADFPHAGAERAPGWASPKARLRSLRLPTSRGPERAPRGLRDRSARPQ